MQGSFYTGAMVVAINLVENIGRIAHASGNFLESQDGASAHTVVLDGAAHLPRRVGVGM
jgi:hypothetical protein